MYIIENKRNLNLMLIYIMCHMLSILADKDTYTCIIMFTSLVFSKTYLIRESFFSRDYFKIEHGFFLFFFLDFSTIIATKNFEKNNTLTIFHNFVEAP